MRLPQDTTEGILQHRNKPVSQRGRDGQTPHYITSLSKLSTQQPGRQSSAGLLLLRKGRNMNRRQFIKSLGAVGAAAGILGPLVDEPAAKNIVARHAENPAMTIGFKTSCPLHLGDELTITYASCEPVKLIVEEVR